MKHLTLTCTVIVLAASLSAGCRKKVSGTAAVPPAPQASEASVEETPTPATHTSEEATPAPSNEPAPASQPPEAGFANELQRLLNDALFDYDRYTIRPDAGETLTRNAEALRKLLERFADASVTIEGHADERGSAEYNLALADRRAAAASEFLNTLGISEGRFSRVSYGKERPLCTEGSEDCWQRNRRVHFSAR